MKCSLKVLSQCGINYKGLFISALFLLLVGCGGKKEEAPISVTKGQNAAQLEKEKALSNPYPNDFGPEKLDVSGYSKERQEGYHLMVKKCSVCHSAARPLNSQFVDLKNEEMEELKRSQPETLKDKKVWQVEPKIWQRYVKRMMAKPGCGISDVQGKKIFKFLREDSSRRKLGDNASKWAGERNKLLVQFKIKYPDRYRELFSD